MLVAFSVSPLGGESGSVSKAVAEAVRVVRESGLPNETTAVSLIDRLLHHAVVLVTAGESFRMREARTRGGGVPLKVD